MPLRKRKNVIGITGAITVAVVLLMVAATIVWLMYGFEYAIEEVDPATLAEDAGHDAFVDVEPPENDSVEPPSNATAPPP